MNDLLNQFLHLNIDSGTTWVLITIVGSTTTVVLSIINNIRRHFDHKHTFDPSKWNREYAREYPNGDAVILYKNTCLGCGDLVEKRTELESPREEEEEDED